jgi:hypothetical protein
VSVGNRFIEEEWNVSLAFSRIGAGSESICVNPRASPFLSAVKFFSPINPQALDQQKN